MMYGLMVWWVWYLLRGGVDGLSGYGPSMRFGALDCTGSGARAIQLEKEKFDQSSRLEKKNLTVSVGEGVGLSATALSRFWKGIYGGAFDCTGSGVRAIELGKEIDINNSLAGAPGFGASSAPRAPSASAVGDQGDLVAVLGVEVSAQDALGSSALVLAQPGFGGFGAGALERSKGLPDW
jgi:hypothetical protein